MEANREKYSRLNKRKMKIEQIVILILAISLILIFAISIGRVKIKKENQVTVILQYENQLKRASVDSLAFLKAVHKDKFVTVLLGDKFVRVNMDHVKSFLFVETK